MLEKTKSAIPSISVILPIAVKREMYDYVNNLVKKGRYKSKAEYFKRAVLEKMTRDDKNMFLCDFCHRKFKRNDNPVVSIEHTSEGIAIRKVHKSCNKKSSPFDDVFEGVKSKGVKASA